MHFEIRRGRIYMTEKKIKNLELKAQRKKKKRIKLICICSSVALVIIAAVIAGVLIYKHYNPEDEGSAVSNNSHAIFSEESLSNGEGVFDGTLYEIKTVDKTDISATIAEIKNRDEALGAYRLVKHTSGSDGYFELNYWTDALGKGYYEYVFGGDSMGTGLSGTYYRTTIDGHSTIVEYSSGTYYTSGEFFDKHHGALSEIMLDSMLEDILSAEYTEAGKNSSGDVVLKAEGLSICIVGGEHYDTYILDQRGGKAVGYYLSYGYAYDMPNI